MSLEILKVKDPKHKVNKLDEKLHPHLPRHPHTLLIVSQPRSGKTCLLINLLSNPTFYNCLEYWQEVLYCSPTQKFDKTAMHVLPKLDNVIQIDDHNELQRLDILLDDIKERQMKRLDEDDPKTGKKKEMERILIIFDDCLSYLKDNDSLSYFITKFRHFNCSIWITTQSFRKIPGVIRNCIGNVIHHKLSNEKELIKLDEEYGCNFSPNYMEISKQITKEKYDFVYMDNENLKLYHNFTDLVLDAAA